MPDHDPGLDAPDRPGAPEALDVADPLGGAPLPLGVELTPTGHPAVDAGLARLAALDGVPTGAHVAVYEDVHQRLTDTLAALDRD
ncbi:hypothetical protein [Kitasatospora sp. A2-31]|uniref:hypothetical protein n=1 Tax=Kitasatospora sp. A2-31 TaxID=2916414 RepID=UPI001EEB6132|nr:hypothetical protein [Kitasatospora sp. A2-31]MCG6496822.1 hypothetical protein [Kitasatospora sp. A2-31]